MVFERVPVSDVQRVRGAGDRRAHRRGEVLVLLERQAAVVERWVPADPAVVPGEVGRPSWCADAVLDLDVGSLNPSDSPPAAVS